jgi:G3E family GTPase
MRLPTVLIGGYLGAGKTTLVNHLLRKAQGLRIAVLVNDFGSIGIDAELIASAAPGGQADVLSLAGGCLCCSFGNDLYGTLKRLLGREPVPQLVLIELSGVALPAAVRASAALLPEVDIQGTLVLVDAEQIQRQLVDRYVGATVRAQLCEADWVLVNKPDLVDSAALPALAADLSGQAPGARVMVAAAGELPAELVFGWHGQASAVTPVFAPRRMALPPNHADAVFASRAATLDDGLDLPGLMRAMADPASGVLRAKGLARGADGQGSLLQLSGARWQLVPTPFDGAGRLVIIGLRHVLEAPGYCLPGIDQLTG